MMQCNKEQSKRYNDDKETRVALSKCGKRAEENCIQAEPESQNTQDRSNCHLYEFITHTIIPCFFFVCISILTYFYLNLSLLQAFFVLSMLIGLMNIIEGIKEDIFLVVLMGVSLAVLSLGLIFIYN